MVSPYGVPGDHLVSPHGDHLVSPHGDHLVSKKVEENKDEVFEEWDDLMEWEAYELAHKEWKTKYEELKSCMAS